MGSTPPCFSGINGSEKQQSPKINKALPFVIYENGKFIIPEETKQYLSNEHFKNIGIISLVGKYRTGKSFLLNRVILNQTKTTGFNVGPTIKPCTKGIWLWSDPLIINNSYCKDPFPCFLIDTEGLEAYDEEINHDSKIFLIAIGISSLFIFNSFGTLDENSINSLSFILNGTKTIKLRSSSFSADDKENVEELSEYFPSLLWLLRDFSLKLENKDGKDITEKEFLEFAGQNIKGTGESIEDKNTIRTQIRNYFPERDCFVMVRPVEKESDLQILQSLPNEKLRKEFLDQAKEFRDKVIQSTKPKGFHNKNLTGSMLVEGVQSVLSAINNGNIPVIENTWKYVVQRELIKNTNNYLLEFTSEINKYRTENSNNPNFSKDVKLYTQRLSSAYINKGKQNGLDEEFSNEYALKLKEKGDIEIEHFDKENEKIFEEHFTKYLNDQIEEFNKNIDNSNDKYSKGYYSFFIDGDKFQNDIEESSPDFPMKRDLGHDGIIQVIKHFIETQLINAQQSTEKQVNLYKNVIDKLQSRLKEVNEELIYLKKETSEQHNNNNSETINYKLKLKATEDKGAKVENEKRNEKENYERVIAELKKDFETRYQEIQNKKQKIDTDLHIKDEQIGVMKLKNEKVTALHQHKFAYLEKEVQLWKDKYNSAVSSTKNNEKVISVELDLLKAQNKSLKTERERIESTQLGLDKNMNSIRNYLHEQMRLQSETNKSVLMKILNIVNMKDEESEKENEIMKLFTATKLKNQDLKEKVKSYENRINTLLEDNRDLELYKEIVSSFKVLQCRFCSATVQSEGFKEHFFKCKSVNTPNNGINKSSIEIRKPIGFLSPNQFIISGSEGSIKQDSQGKAYLEYVIKLKYKNHTWKVCKRFNHFANGSKALSSIYRGIVVMPQSSTIFQEVSDINLNNSFQDNKIKQLQQFIQDIAWIEEINKSKQFHQFLNIDSNINVNEIVNDDFHHQVSSSYVDNNTKLKKPGNAKFINSRNGSEVYMDNTSNQGLNSNQDYVGNKTMINSNRTNFESFTQRDKSKNMGTRKDNYK